MTTPVRTSRERGAAGWLSPSELLELGNRVRAVLEKNPKATTDTIAELTGASMNVVHRIRVRWRNGKKG